MTKIGKRSVSTSLIGGMAGAGLLCLMARFVDSCSVVGGYTAWNVIFKLGLSIYWNAATKSTVGTVVRRYLIFIIYFFWISLKSDITARTARLNDTLEHN